MPNERRNFDVAWLAPYQYFKWLKVHQAQLVSLIFFFKLMRDIMNF